MYVIGFGVGALAAAVYLVGRYRCIGIIAAYF